MLIDLLSPANYLMINRDAIKILGLDTAVYCSELLTIYKKVVNKKAFYKNNFFKVDREYITNVTSLSIESQLSCDLNLEKVGIIVRDDHNPDLIYFDVEIFSSVLASEDVKLLDNVSKKVKVPSPKGLKKETREYQITNLKNNIRCNTPEVLYALRDWIDAIMVDPKKYITAQQVQYFKDKLDDYCNGDLNKALKIIEQATVHQYIDCQWAINAYETDLLVQKNISSGKPFTYKNTEQSTQVRTTNQRIATKDSLSSEVF